MILRLVKRFAGVVALSAAAFALVVVLRTNPEPWSKAEIAQLTVGLNEAAAIGVPHDFLMDKATLQSNTALLAKVEAGDLLGAEESLQYRKIYQKVLLDNQAFLGRFDAELTTVSDHAMEMGNNIKGHGIAGIHDHHDLSARRNFAGLLESLTGLDSASSSFTRIYYANRAQKDLVDLISHLGVAPHTVSVPYVPPDQPWPDQQLGNEFEAMLKAFKAAQFEPIHSPEYWKYVDGGLALYNSLIWDVQGRVMKKTSSWERHISGRFLSPQTLAPLVNLNRALRRN